MKIYDTLIIGSGPAGLAAAVYASRAMLDFAVIEQAAVSGGQMMNTSEIDNYPGFASADGFSLSAKMREHAESLGAGFITDHIQEVKRQEQNFLLIGEQGEYLTKTVIAASGARHRKLGVAGEDRLAGKGVSYCATCDGAFFRGRTVAVVGGGNTAAEDALYLANLCEKVYLVHRRDNLRAGRALAERVLNNPKIQPVWNSQVLEIDGENRVERILLNTEEELILDGVFIAVGVRPNSEWIPSTVSKDEGGFIKADETGVTSVPGFFAAGDLRTKKLRQIITAASDGANAVASVEHFLQIRR
ncbi:thioredoxin-disulfide reductase [Ructibacterium gallinarum]|uniref:Thioredoxin reductase n=1 Tax=Ructibacterium gallinarum TaxID=2779355 RepID=A0A9D5LYW2_9FIRM|nr:thioredoxin-disulfide reductase [Ructibacterium gallinarum]MBE5039006.1 thioredoxin-disulfide reductase [Ructibacterium gallinarum]